MENGLKSAFLVGFR